MTKDKNKLSALNHGSQKPGEDVQLFAGSGAGSRVGSGAGKVLRSFLALCICLTAIMTTAMFTTEGQERRIFRTASLVSLTPEQEKTFFPEEENSFLNLSGNVYSQEAQLEPVTGPDLVSLNKPFNPKGILSITANGIVFQTVNGEIALAAPEDDTFPSLSEEDVLEWCMRDEALDPIAVGRLIASVSLSPAHTGKGSASKYSELVERYAEKYRLSTSLILAIMHTESNFNPFAVSTSSALGLMQVVPETAGNEVYRYLKGSQGTPSVDSLLLPEKNIQYGTTYIHLLSQRYFNAVISQESKDLCIIAAYNGGPGAVLRTFDKDREVAIATINSMTPEEVYETLTTKMPSSESRRYVDVVMAHRKNYSN